MSAALRLWNDPSPNVARLMLFVAASMWSLGGFFIKEIDAGALSIVFFRCLFSAIILAPFIARQRFPGRIDGSVSIVLFLALLILFVASTKETTAANAIFLQYTAPVYVVLFGPLLLSERIRRRDGLPLIICLAGIAVLFLGNSGGDTLGLWLGMGSGFFFGMFFLWARRMRYAGPVAITFMNCAGVALLLVWVPFVYSIDATSLGLIAVMALVQFAVPYVLFTKGIAHVPSAEASLISLIEPVLNPVWVALLYGEDPSTATIIGGAVIIAGLAIRYAVFREPRRDVEAGAQELAGGPAVHE